LFFGFLSGSGIATFSVGIGQTSYWFPRNKQGNVLGLYAGIGNLAPGIFSIILPLFLVRFGLISAYLAWWIFLIIGATLYIILGCNAYYFQLVKKGVNREDAIKKAGDLGQELFPAGTIAESLKISGRTLKTWGLVILYFTTFGGFIALTAWFPIYWSLFFKLSAILAGLLTAVYSLLTSAIRVVGGKLSDQYGLLILFGGAIIITFSETLLLSFMATILIAVGMGLTNAAVFKMLPEYVPNAIGGAAGWVGGLGAFGGFVIPPLMGQIAGSMGMIGYARGFYVFIILTLLCFAIIHLLGKKTMLTAR
jgi:NNP family nitrate/nitrite transporter-like MFS transporter